MKIIADNIDFAAYFEDQNSDNANILPASHWSEDVVDRFHGTSTPSSWTPLGFEKMNGKFDLREGEITLWAGVSGHGKSTLLSHIMLKVQQAEKRVCLASFEMRPRDTMAKMTQQAAGVGVPSPAYIRAFHTWTDDRLWVLNHLGRMAVNRVLGVALYVRNVLKINHLVIDSLMKCGLGTDDYTGQKDFVDALCAIARDTGLHIHLIVHMRKGESETRSSGIFDVKGASEIVDMVDNLIIITKNLLKIKAIEDAHRERKLDKREELLKQVFGKPDAYLRVAKQRHFAWEGTLAFWFDKASQQFLSSANIQPVFNGLTLDLAPAVGQSEVDDYERLDSWSPN